MRDRRLSLPELFLIAATRGMLGLGAGLLLAEHLDRDRRKLVGGVLVGIGALSTIPLALRVLRGGGHGDLRESQGTAAHGRN
ncbi:MAG: hypothetical protein JO257_21475 [Deltaproteobacteria bacterium]|nr:hypothetical protein [Deltaproteobacteria bacterium]